MIQYILECIAFQLVFLIIYDFFLKRETFFQWNRAYLIGTYLLSMTLPWIKIEALKTSVSERYNLYPEYLWGINDAAVNATVQSDIFQISWQEGLLFGGMVLATLFFGYKMLQLYRLRRTGEINHYHNFTKIIIVDSHIAFSFFRSIFLGDKVVAKEHRNIIEHELVHIQQLHSYDLLFFELMRIVGWFDPLVYVYQNRISELHEFIADAQVAKTDKNEQYELLLSEAFQTQNISFINQFFNSSLIKKRIVMLTKEKSRKIWKLKYLALVPMVLGMLFYTSCEHDLDQNADNQQSITVGDVENLTEEEESNAFARLIELSSRQKDWVYSIKDKNSTVTFLSAPEGSGISGPNGTLIKAKMQVESKILDEDFDFFNLNPSDTDDKGVPFSVVEEAPIFPGCEDAADPRACFQEKIQKHIGKNFRYPDEAQKQGIQGRVAIMFTIDEQGNIVNIRKRGPHKLLEAETVRIIEKLPQMQPGKSGGKAVRVPFSIPITFKLQQAGFNSPSTNVKEQDTVSQKTSLNYKTPDPLYMVDGKESSKEEVDLIDPKNIQDINVLKGEWAESKHGSKGKNGVVEISTKRFEDNN
ncbi:MAG: TonB family protein [Pricia sp.]